MASKFETAVVLCGGLGTRDLPHSLFRPNTLGEVGNRNSFDIITAGLAGVGVDNLIVVIPDSEVRPGVNLTELELSAWFWGSPSLQADLMAKGKPQSLIDAAGSHDYGISGLYFAKQSQQVYGTAASLGAAIPQLETLGADGFLVVNSDGFMHREDGGSDIADMLDRMRSDGYEHGLLTSPVPKISTGKYAYGIIKRDSAGEFKGIEEGPYADDVTDMAPEANVGVYAFSSDVFGHLRDYLGRSLEELGRPEYWITDIVGRLATDSPIMAHRANGVFVDCATSELRAQAVKILSDRAE